MGNALKIRDKDGNFVGIPAISGADGKSAYQYAVDGGFQGTEEDFMMLLGALGGNPAQVSVLDDYEEHLGAKNNPHKVTAAQVGALPIGGGTLTGAELFLRGGLARVAGGQDYVQLDVFDTEKDSKNRRKLVLNGGNKTTIDKAAIISDTKNGAETVYTLYGTHNKPTAKDVGAVPLSRQFSGKDLLTMTDEGNFYITNAQNTPSSKAGYLRVVPHPTASDYRVIYWRDYNSTTEYVNVLEEGSWSGWTKVGAVPKLSQTGTYTGTGTAGQDNPCSLTFDAPPKFVVISDHMASYIGFFIRGVNQFIVFSSNGIMSSGANVTWSGNTLTWYMANGGQYYQLNGGTWTYTYVAIF